MSANMHAEPDIELLRAHQAGDQSAFEALYARYRVPTFAYLMRRCGGALAESSFRATWRAAATSDAVDTDHEFVAQLFGLAHAEVERVAPEAVVTPESTLPELTQRTRQRAQRFERSLRQVSTHEREAYLLYEEGGLTLIEIGDILGIDPEVARERVRRALSALRDGLDAPILDPSALHDPAVAVAHLAGRRKPSPMLDAVVLDEARRAAEANAARARERQSRFRLWPYLLLIGAALALAQMIVFWTSPSEPQLVEPAPLPATVVIAPEDLPVADPIVAPEMKTVRLFPKSVPATSPKTPKVLPNESSPMRAAPRSAPATLPAPPPARAAPTVPETTATAPATAEPLVPPETLDETTPPPHGRAPSVQAPSR